MTHADDSSSSPHGRPHPKDAARRHLGWLLLAAGVAFSACKKQDAVGTNEEAVRLAGIDTRRVKLAVFVASGAGWVSGSPCVCYCAADTCAGRPGAARVSTA